VRAVIYRCCPRLAPACKRARP